MRPNSLVLQRGLCRIQTLYATGWTQSCAECASVVEMGCGLSTKIWGESPEPAAYSLAHSPEARLALLVPEIRDGHHVPAHHGLGCAEVVKERDIRKQLLPQCTRLRLHCLHDCRSNKDLSSRELDHLFGRFAQSPEHRSASQRCTVPIKELSRSPGSGFTEQILKAFQLLAPQNTTESQCVKSVCTAVYSDPGPERKYACVLLCQMILSQRHLT